MKILLDTNVVLDILLDRQPFKENSYKAIKTSLEKGHVLYISATAITDIFYILRKACGSKKDALINMRNLLKIISIAKVDEDDIVNAFASSISDFEDAVVNEVAVSIKANLILTRNVKDFKNASVKIMNPKDFLK